jgi:hypothetical protein
MTAATRDHLRPVSGLGPLTSPGAPGAIGPEGVPIPVGPALAAPRTTGRTTDGIACEAGEQVAFHIHSHLTIFVNGIAQEVPAAVGIANPQPEATAQGPFIGAGSCFYWLHTHAADGIIHIESPEQRTFTLGDFFDEWNQPLSAGQVGSAKGTVAVIVNGKVWKGSPRNVPLGSHENLQVEVGTPLVAPETINWSITGL